MGRLVVQRKKCLDARREIAHNGLAALEVAQPLFAAVANEQHAAIRAKAEPPHPVHQDQHARDVGRVVPHAGAVQPPVFLAHRHRLQIWEHRVDMRHHDGDFSAFLHAPAASHVFCVVDFGGKSAYLQPFPDEGRAALLPMARRGNPAKRFDQFKGFALRRLDFVLQRGAEQPHLHARSPFCFSAINSNMRPAFPAEARLFSEVPPWMNVSRTTCVFSATKAVC